MATVLAQPLAVPVGAIKRFGPHGREYEVLDMAPVENGQAMVNIILVQTGERLTYPLEAVLQEAEAI